MAVWLKQVTGRLWFIELVDYNGTSVFFVDCGLCREMERKALDIARLLDVEVWTT